MFGLLPRCANNWAGSQCAKLLAWVAGSLQSRETYVTDFACVWDRNFPTKITAKLLTNIQLFVKRRNEYSVEVLCSFSQPYYCTIVYKHLDSTQDMLYTKTPRVDHASLALYPVWSIFNPSAIPNGNLCLDCQSRVGILIPISWANRLSVLETGFKLFIGFTYLHKNIVLYKANYCMYYAL